MFFLKNKGDAFLQNLHVRHSHDGIIEQCCNDDTGEQQKPQIADATCENVGGNHHAQGSQRKGQRVLEKQPQGIAH